MPRPVDIVVIGGGIVGLATAHRLSRRFPDLALAVLEKEERLAAHQTGHNSGVIHSGIYYRPGSSKARLCVAGAARLKSFCARHGIACQECGKVVVALREGEIPRLEELLRRGRANGVPGVTRVDRGRLREIEPHAAGIAALHVPGAGIVDYAEVAAKLGGLIEEGGGRVLLGTRVRRVREKGGGVTLATTRGDLRARWAVACAGLQCDRLARRSGLRVGLRIVPFRGEYYRLAPGRDGLVRGLVYPAPDPRFPFLGVHLTRTIRGGVDAGPNAVLALCREGYRRWSFRPRDALDTLTYPGFWHLARRHWRYGCAEIARSARKPLFVRSVRRLVPEIRACDLVRGGAGVRAQALDPAGALVDDFRIESRSRVLHVLNAPSPAATAALAIADEILDRAERAFGLTGGTGGPR